MLGFYNNKIYDNFLDSPNLKITIKYDDGTIKKQCNLINMDFNNIFSIQINKNPEETNKILPEIYEIDNLKELIYHKNEIIYNPNVFNQQIPTKIANFQNLTYLSVTNSLSYEMDYEEIISVIDNNKIIILSPNNFIIDDKYFNLEYMNIMLKYNCNLVHLYDNLEKIMYNLPPNLKYLQFMTNLDDVHLLSNLPTSLQQLNLVISKGKISKYYEIIGKLKLPYGCKCNYVLFDIFNRCDYSSCYDGYFQDFL